MKHSSNQSFIFAIICLASLATLLLPQASHAEDPATLNTSTEKEKGILNVLSSFGQKLSGGNKDPFLPLDQVFIFSAEIASPNSISASWNIADGYYLYRAKFRFAIKGPNEDARDIGITLGDISLPHGKEKHDESFGLSEVFIHEMVVQLPLQRTNLAATDITLVVGYQGCADAGFCYPPTKQEVLLSLPEATTAIETPTSSSDDSAFISDQDRYAKSLADGNIALSMLTFFGLGLLLTFTPCVFPMIPILSSIIAGQGSDITTRRAFWLSLIYVLAMAVTYTAAGIFAGLFGGNLQAAFQDPWILGAFSGVFVLLALSMFGFYELQLPQSLQSKLAEMSNKQQGGTFIGVGIMGFLSALIVGPCLAAPLAAALIYIGQTGDAVLGGAALFALSLGMGAPLLAIGTSAGKLLPKAGPWMDTIKAIFGVLLLGLAIWLLERIIPAAATLALWGILLIVCAIYLGAFNRLQPEAGGWRKFWKGTGIVVLIYGCMLLIGASSGGNNILQPLANLCVGEDCEAATPEHSLGFEQIKGLTGLQQALEKASQQNKYVMLDFYADWCISCIEMEKYTFSDSRVQAALADTILLQADVTANDEQDQALMNAFGLFGPPSMLFFDTSGQELAKYRLVGFLDASDFEAHVKTALNQ